MNVWFYKSSNQHIIYYQIIHVITKHNKMIYKSFNILYKK